MKLQGHSSLLRSKWLLPTLFSLLFLLPACVTEKSPVTGRSRVYGMSWNQEVEVGKDANAQIIQEYGLLNDPAIQAYVSTVGNRVLSKSDLRKPSTPAEYRNTPFKFQVLNSEVVNAFAIPGGYIYVTRGLLNHLENEAQLSVVLGHEIAHVAARHSAQQALQSQVGQLGLAAGSIIGAQVLGNPDAAGQIASLGSTGLQLLSLKYSRSDESQADELGVQYAVHAGYDAAQAAGFFESLKRIGQKEGGRLPTWLSSHPDPGDREQRVVKLARQYRRPMQMLAVNRDLYLHKIEGLVVGENPREGFVKNNTFYHPELGFQFAVPPGWKVQNESSAVTLISPQQDAALVFHLVPGNSPQEAATRFSNLQGVQVTGSKATTINGHNAVAVTAQAQTRQGTVGLLNYFLGFNGKVFSFMGYSSASRLASYAPRFTQLVQDCSKVTDPAILNLQPARLRLVRVQQPAPFSSLVPTSRAQLTPEDLAIMNQVKLGQTIPAGTILKLPSS